MTDQDILRMAGDAGLLTLLDEFSYRSMLEGREPVLERFREFVALILAARQSL
jgi:hypothetical protein